MYDVEDGVHLAAANPLASRDVHLAAATRLARQKQCQEFGPLPLSSFSTCETTSNEAH